MVQINFARREVACKIVYYGAGLSGKTTNIEKIHEKAPNQNKGTLTSIATEGDRTLFFDFLPLDLGEIAGMRTKFQLYTVPGQVFYNSTRKLVLQGADGVIFVADSDPAKMADNLESLKNLEENLKEHGLNIRAVPLIYQFNKRDLANAVAVDEMKRQLSLGDHAVIVEAAAVKGEGVMHTLKELAKKVIDRLNESAPSSSTAAMKPEPARKEAVSVPAASLRPAPSAVPVMASHEVQEGKGASAPPPVTKPTYTKPPEKPQPPAPPVAPRYTGFPRDNRDSRAWMVWVVLGTVVVVGIAAALLFF